MVDQGGGEGTHNRGVSWLPQPSRCLRGRKVSYPLDVVPMVPTSLLLGSHTEVLLVDQPRGPS